MSKKTNNVSQKERAAVLQALYSAATTFNEKAGTRSFIESILTESEKMRIGRRILIAQLLLAGCTRMEIVNTLNVSPNTIAQARKWIEQELPEYATTVKLASEKKVSARSVTKKSYDTTTIEGLRNKYPMHFLLFNVADEIMQTIRSTRHR